MPSTAAPPRRAGKRRSAKKKKLSRQFKPEGMTLDEWQIALRRQFGREQKFRMQNVGDEPVFSEFAVTNPESGSKYRVVIRGARPGDNFCTCPDFATNTLGTCKHVEFTLARLERKPGAKTALRDGYQPPYSEVVLKYGARREVRFLPGTQCPPPLTEAAKKYFDSEGVLRPAAFARFEKFLSLSSEFDHDLRCNSDALAFVAEVRDGEERRRRIDEAFPAGIRSPALDKLLKADLYDYQREGALFAARAGRCLVGDEMGLGKTIQALAAAEIMARHVGVERVLIICPTSLKHQWEREISKFTERSACVIQGLRASRQVVFGSNAFFKITNYDTVHRDLDLIQGWSPDLVILDEAQRIKNWKTRAARSVKKIASPFAIVLTGTPLENRLEELVSIVQFVDQHRLGPTFRFLADHQLTDDVGKVIGYKDLDTIGKTLAPVLIRRQKAEVAKQLPERLDKNFFVPMTPQQMVHHEENREVVARIVYRWRKHRFLSEADQRRLMIALQNMRMSCNSTYLLDATTDHGVKVGELLTLLDEMFERPDTKVVIFSQWLRTHELIERRLKGGKDGHVLFHGGVPGPKRKALVDRFREDDRCRAFLSTDAGGVGLNLQNASVVVNMDLPWNPAVLEQRIGRVHRLGQSRPVQVVNFVAQGTIEEGMLNVLKFKKSLFAGVLDGGEKEVFLGGSRLTRFMETVEKAASNIPAPAPPEPEPSPTEGPEGASAAAPGDADEVPEAPAQPPGVPTVPAPAVVSADPWAGLFQTGLSLLQELAGAARPQGGSAEQPAASRAGLSVVRRDRETGEPYLHLPMPSPDLLERVLNAAGELLRGLRR
jgi:superfamily II DNA or RNA helicase